MVLSTHLIDEVSDLLENVLVIDDGEVIIDSDAESLRGSATTVVGKRSDVEAFAARREILHRDGIGGIATVTVARLTETERSEALARGLELTPVSLQQLIVQKTKAPSQEFEQSA